MGAGLKTAAVDMQPVPNFGSKIGGGGMCMSRTTHSRLKQRSIMMLATVWLWVPLCLTAAQKTPAPALPFIENDYARALNEAKARNLPLFVEAWAPW